VNKIVSTEEREKGHKRISKMFFLFLGLIMIFGIVSSIFLLSPKPKKLNPRWERLSELTLPPDGLKLYSFLLKEIPDTSSLKFPALVVVSTWTPVTKENALLPEWNATRKVVMSSNGLSREKA
jgi:hypothetical protein